MRRVPVAAIFAGCSGLAMFCLLFLLVGSGVAGAVVGALVAFVGSGLLASRPDRRWRYGGKGAKGTKQ